MADTLSPLRWLTLGAGLAALGVAAGAFGAHGLKTMVPPARLITFQTGVRYHLFHALGLMLLSALEATHPNLDVDLPGKLLAIGVLLFSGSLYLLVLTNTPWLGAITPLGGLALISGWGLLAYRSYSRPTN
jgi:uncharacterized membrane protein YgdD (TMEM256/DUF423 family)